jgi:hypothetical protein
MSDVIEQAKTVKTHLKPIDRDGLMAFAEKGRNNPQSMGGNKVHTIMQGMYRSLSYVGNHQPVVVDEPLHLFGEDTAPAPGEIVLSGLGVFSCWYYSCSDMETYPIKQARNFLRSRYW